MKLVAFITAAIFSGLLMGFAVNLPVWLLYSLLPVCAIGTVVLYRILSATSKISVELGATSGLFSRVDEYPLYVVHDSGDYGFSDGSLPHCSGVLRIDALSSLGYNLDVLQKLSQDWGSRRSPLIGLSASLSSRICALSVALCVPSERAGCCACAPPPAPCIIE
jgi:hypothetical protein